MRARRLTPGLLLWAWLGALAAHADVDVQAGGQRLRIATTGGLPLLWQACAPACDAPGAMRADFVGAGDGALEWFAVEPALAVALRDMPYDAVVTDTPEGITVVLTAREIVAGRRLVQRYALSHRAHTVQLALELPPGAALQAASGRSLVPEPLPGFGAGFSDVEPVRVTAQGQERLGAGAVQAGAGAWLGVRARFWAWLAEPAQPTDATVESAGEQRWRVRWQGGAGALDLTVYAGPVQWQALRAGAPVLTQMLFAALWEPLRALCYGLYFLLGWISGGVAQPGIAIILLSLAVKIILAPLTALADRWQQQVNRIQSRIQPRLAGIRARHRGEEAHRLTLQVYRDAGVHPIFTLKSLAGFAIQVPMFIAAFDMLADNFALAGARFLWIDDLAAPDRFAALPVALPFFGAHFNLLPAIMTAVTVYSAWTLRDATLTPALLAKQQRQLYLMAGLFFLLFYTFPAGMVLYWTANNGWHLAKVQVGRWLGRSG